MTVDLVEHGTFRATAKRSAAWTAWMVRSGVIALGLAKWIVSEVAYTMAEDREHGRISQDPRDWERD